MQILVACQFIVHLSGIHAWEMKDGWAEEVSDATFEQKQSQPLWNQFEDGQIMNLPGCDLWTKKKKSQLSVICISV